KAGKTTEAMQGWKRLREFPFDSERKMMSVCVERQGKQMVAVKGAPDVLLDHCKEIGWQGRVTLLTPSLKKQIRDNNQAMANQSIRVLAIAYRDVASREKVDNQSQAESGLVFVGLCGMIDPPREEVKGAIKECRLAGIKTVMITGDHQT